MIPSRFAHRASWRRPVRLPEFPLIDEAHVADWKRYESEAGERGVASTLTDKLIQLQFPIAVGISETPAYQRATRGGVAPLLTFETPASFHRPDELEILFHQSMAGTLPVIRAPDRRDFVTLVRALTGRNEPIEVPPSMGACLVKGLNNWDRIRRYRQRWETTTEGPSGPGEWRAALGRLQQRAQLYQDSFLLLAEGEYSGVTGSDVGLTPRDWLERSRRLRLAHESAHYLVLRVFNRFPNRVLDELVADMMGIVEAFGYYSSYLALQFLGLEEFPRYRPGGRLENYCAAPVGSVEFADQAGLTNAAALAIEGLAAGLGREDQEALAELVVGLTASTLELVAARRLGAAGGGT